MRRASDMPQKPLAMYSSKMALLVVLTVSNASTGAMMSHVCFAACSMVAVVSVSLVKLEVEVTLEGKTMVGMTMVGMTMVERMIVGKAIVGKVTVEMTTNASASNFNTCEKKSVLIKGFPNDDKVGPLGPNENWLLPAPRHEPSYAGCGC